MERLYNTMEVWCGRYFTESESHFLNNMAAYHANLKSQQYLKISAWSVVPGNVAVNNINPTFR